MQKQHTLSLVAVSFFIFLAVGSKVNKIHYGAFQYDNYVEKESGTYLVRNDGTRVPGQRVKWKSGMLTKDQISIDDEKFKLSDIRGYQQGKTYYARQGNEYIKRIVHGKVNVYVKFTDATSTTTDANGRIRTRHYTRTDHYAQRGDDGPMEIIAGQKDMARILADCPLSVEMASLKNSKMRKAIRSNRNYLNEIFEVYNNGCKPVR